MIVALVSQDESSNLWRLSGCFNPMYYFYDYSVATAYQEIASTLLCNDDCSIKELLIAFNLN